MPYRKWLCWMWVLSLGCSHPAYAEIKKKLDEPKSYQLISRVYGDLHGGFFEYSPAVDKTFYVYQGIGRPGTEGGFGYFAVNPWTGDIWALWGCYKINKPRLPALKAEIRRRFTPEELRQYRRLSRLKPDCVVD